MSDGPPATTFYPADHPHRRLNPLTGEYVLVSPHRAKRPWQGQVEAVAPDDRPAYDPDCYLCPGNTRVGGHVNPRYTGTFVFDNDFAALLPDAPAPPPPTHPLLRADGVQGTSRVICFSPRHDLTLARMGAVGIRTVVDLWAGQVTDLGARYRWVQVFENRGAIMGSSNPHPHGQVWATSVLPNEAAREDTHQHAYYAAHGRPLLVDYAQAEVDADVRVVAANDHWLALVPFWAFWPFETLVLPRQAVQHLPALDGPARDALADVLARLLARYDHLFGVPFPYSMGWHGAPTGPDAPDAPHWTLHAHIYPPLLRSATVQKFRVGFELLGESQRDLTPEQAAARLRDLPDHFAP